MIRIGVGAPCHTRDEGWGVNFIEILDAMNPQPVARCIYFNDGSEGLGTARKFCFDYLFKEMDCDIVLNASVDHGLFPDILAQIRPDVITGFGYLMRKPATVVSLVKRYVARNAWTGVYSMPRKIWMAYRESPGFEGWTGEDGAVHSWALANRIPIHIVRAPKYWVLRYSDKMKALAVELGGLKGMSKLVDAWDDD